MEGKTDRLLALEGLRGLAAVSVVIYHTLVLFYPIIYYGVAPIQHFRFEDNLHGNPLIGLIAGAFAVAIFFVLSGFVLSVGFFRTKRESIIRRLAIKRYPRLMIPALASVIFAWMLISLGLSFNNQAYDVTMSSALNLQWSSLTNFANALYEGTIGIFTSGSIFNYNSVLWTMQYEFVGSFIVFIVALIFGRSRVRPIVYIALILALYNTWFLGFIIGMILADVYVNRSKLFLVHKAYYYVLLVIGVFLGGYPWEMASQTIYGYIMIPWLSNTQNLALYTTLGAALVMVAVLNIVPLKTLLSKRPLTQLGKYTYSLYLVHQPIIYSIGLGMFLFFYQSMGYNRSVLLSILCTVPVIIIVTFLFRKFIEKPTLRFADGIDRTFRDRRYQRIVARRVMKPIHRLVNRWNEENKISFGDN